MTERKHKHSWIYRGPVCCGHRLECKSCPKVTKVRAVEGYPEIGDPIKLDEDQDIGIKIETKIKSKRVRSK